MPAKALAFVNEGVEEIFNHLHPITCSRENGAEPAEWSEVKADGSAPQDALAEVLEDCEGARVDGESKAHKEGASRAAVAAKNRRPRAPQAPPWLRGA